LYVGRGISLAEIKYTNIDPVYHVIIVLNIGSSASVQNFVGEIGIIVKI